MIETAKTRQILIDQGASEECPRDISNLLDRFKFMEAYWDQGFGFVDGKLQCNGFTECGYVSLANEHIHSVCANCEIRGVEMPLSHEEYLKKIKEEIIG